MKCFHATPPHFVLFSPSYSKLEDSISGTAQLWMNCLNWWSHIIDRESNHQYNCRKEKENQSICCYVVTPDKIILSPRKNLLHQSLSENVYKTFWLDSFKFIGLSCLPYLMGQLILLKEYSYWQISRLQRKRLISIHIFYSLWICTY